MSLKTFTAGERLTAQDLNDNFSTTQYGIIYTGTDLNVSSGGTTTATYEIGTVATANLGAASYLEIDVSGYIALTGRTGAGTITYKIETKEVGGSYSDSLATRTMLSLSDNGTNYINLINSQNVSKHLHTLTAGEIANGVTIQITLTASATGSSVSAFTNGSMLVKPITVA